MHVDAHELRREITAFQATGQASEALGSLILCLCQHLADRDNFRHYSFREDMIQAAAFTCLRAARKVDLARGTSLFSYFTQVAWRAMILEIRVQNVRGFTPKDGRTLINGRRVSIDPEFAPLDGLAVR